MWKRNADVIEHPTTPHVRIQRSLVTVALRSEKPTRCRTSSLPDECRATGIIPKSTCRTEPGAILPRRCIYRQCCVIHSPYRKPPTSHLSKMARTNDMNQAVVSRAYAFGFRERVVQADDAVVVELVIVHSCNIRLCLPEGPVSRRNTCVDRVIGVENCQDGAPSRCVLDWFRGQVVLQVAYRCVGVPRERQTRREMVDAFKDAICPRGSHHVGHVAFRAVPAILVRHGYKCIHLAVSRSGCECENGVIVGLWVEFCASAVRDTWVKRNKMGWGREEKITHDCRKQCPRFL